MTAMSDEEMEHMVAALHAGGLPFGIRDAEEEGLRSGGPPDRAVHRGERPEEHGARAAGRGAERLVAEYPYIQFAYVVNAEGVKITRNITQVVDRAKYAKIDLHEDFSDRDWFINPLKTGKVSVTGLYTSRITAPCASPSPAPYGTRRARSSRSWASTSGSRTSQRRRSKE